MTEAKKVFLQNNLIFLMNKLSGDEKANWGKMNAQQMIEHVSAFFKVSTQKIQFPLTTHVEHLPKYKEFLLSEKEFKENTKAPASIIPEDVLPLHYSGISQAKEAFTKSVNDFFEFFKNDPNKTTLHPVFGELNFNEWVQLHHSM